MPLPKGLPVADAIRELVHHGSHPRPMKQIIAIAESNHRRHGGGGIAHRDTGGGLPGAVPQAPITQTPAASVSPMVQNQVKQFANLPTEKLTELAAQYGNSPQGQIIGKLVQARRMGQAPNPPTNTSPAVPQAPQGPQVPGQGISQGSSFGGPPVQQQNRGGGIAHRDMGGSMGISPSMASPWWERAEERGSGMLTGSTMGRSDRLMATAPSGSYILPADVVAGLGEGNSLAGARVIDEMLHSNPYGIQGSKTRSRQPPEARAPMPREDDGEGQQFAAKGGGLRASGVKDGSEGENVPVALSHGEYQVSPEHVRMIGHGNLKAGHAILDSWVMKMRAHQIEKLKKLKPPVGAKKKAA